MCETVVKILPCVEGDLSQCVTGVLLLIDVSILNTEPENRRNVVSHGSIAEDVGVEIHCIYVYIFQKSLTVADLS